MSAYIVGKPHIDALLTVALDGPADRGPRHAGDGWHRPYHAGAPMTPEQADDVGAMLAAECVRSVQYRYHGEPLDTLPGPADRSWITAGYEYAPGRALAAVEALKACDGYEYQSCEHPAWEGSDARAWLDSLRSRLIGALPGYDEADTWEVGPAVDWYVAR